VKSIRHAFRAVVAVGLLSCVACGGGYSVAEPGPPDYAPAYGYRYRQGHVVYIYDDRVSAYRVAHYHNVFYDHGHYYRLSGGTWYHTTHLSGGWTPAGHESVPPGLAKKYSTKYKSANHEKKTTAYKKKGMHGH
jgi:hypothetical protein